MIQGNDIRTVTLRVYLRGDGALNSWAIEPTSFSLDGLLLGISVLEPGGPTVTVQKVSLGGVDTFNFTGTNGYAPTSVTTTTPGTVAAGTRRTLAVPSTPTTITEAATTGYRLSDISCSGLGVTGAATPSYVNNGTIAGSVTINAIATQPGWNVVCTFTNQRIPTLRLRKTLPTGRVAPGDQFTLSMSGPNAPAAITTSGTGTLADGVLVHSSPSIGSVYTLSETGAGSPASVLSNYVTTYACTNALAGGQAPSGSGTSFSITPVAGDDLTCTFSNAKRPILRLRKALPLGRAQPGDQFELEIMDGLGMGQALETSGAGTTANGTVSINAVADSIYTLAEFAIDSTNLSHYETTYSCTNALPGGQAPNGSATSFDITPVAGDDLTCTFINLPRTADVSVQKTASASTATSGQSVQFTLLVSNAGPAAADGAVIRDPASAGLDCISVTCVAAGSATCPGALSASALQSPGLTIPALPSGGSVTLQLTCKVTASGF